MENYYPEWYESDLTFDDASLAASFQASNGGANSTRLDIGESGFRGDLELELIMPHHIVPSQGFMTLAAPLASFQSLHAQVRAQAIQSLPLTNASPLGSASTVQSAHSPHSFAARSPLLSKTPPMPVFHTSLSLYAPSPPLSFTPTSFPQELRSGLAHRPFPSNEIIKPTTPQPHYSTTSLRVSSEQHSLPPSAQPYPATTPGKTV